MAQLVERDLAKVEAAGSSPVYRSCTKEEVSGWISLFSYKEHINIDGTTGHVKRSERDISLTPSIARRKCRKLKGLRRFLLRGPAWTYILSQYTALRKRLKP